MQPVGMCGCVHLLLNNYTWRTNRKIEYTLLKRLRWKSMSGWSVLGSLVRLTMFVFLSMGEYRTVLVLVSLIVLTSDQALG